MGIVMLLAMFAVLGAMITNVITAGVAFTYIKKEKRVSFANGMLLFAFVTDMIVCAYVISEFVFLHLS